MRPFVIRTLLDGRAAAPRYLRQAALLAASWHASARDFAPFEVRLIGETPERFRAFLREIGARLVAAHPDPSDAHAKTANCISGGFQDADERILLLDNDTCFLSAPEALAMLPEDACAGAAAGEARLSPEQWRRIERGLGLAALPSGLPTLRERHRAAKRGRRPAGMGRLYVNAGVLLLPASRVFPALWSLDVARIRGLFEGHPLASDAVCGSCQAGLAMAIARHRRFVPLPAGYNYRPIDFVLGERAGELPTVLHMTGDGEVAEGERIEEHLDAYWAHFVVRRLERLRPRIGEAAQRQRLEHLDRCRTELSRRVREYALDAVVGARGAGPRVTGDPPPRAAEPERTAPVVIGGLGGSGTRIVAEIVQGLGVHIGTHLNRSLDHLWFALLFKRPRWFEAGIDPAGVERSIALFEKATFAGLAAGLAPDEAAWLEEIERDLRGFQGSPRRLGVSADEIASLRSSAPARFAGFSAWGWKEPNSHLFLDGLSAHFPRLRYVHVVRHGLDMAFSDNANQLENWGRVCGVDLPESGPSAPVQLEYWIRTTRAVAERRRRGERVLLLSFDALCAEPRASIRALADFLALRCSEARLEALAEIPVRPASRARYRARGLSGFSAEQLDAVCELGFPVEPPRPGERWAARLRAFGERAWRTPRTRTHRR